MTVIYEGGQYEEAKKNQSVKGSLEKKKC